ncbi:hypothetical protein FB451DRAFT_1139719 [Mycena latifolia]|nr:hypothetical protein FB451DRAFT_1139719 [Mycena latifolia]
MPASKAPNAPGSRSSQQGRLLQPLKPAPSSNSDWLPAFIFTAKAISAAGESLPFPYVKGVFGSAVFLLETVHEVQKNRDNMKELCADTVDIIAVIRDRVSFHRDTAALQFKVQCEEFESLLQDVVEAVHHRQMKPRGFGARLKEVVKSGSTSEEITGFRERIREIRSNFMLMTTMDTNFGMQKVLNVISPSVSVPEVLQVVNNCPPPTKIFRGRRTILGMMHHYYAHDAEHQAIFLLHGLGGAGKTQIALKFIQESASQFTDIFLIDTSTLETIDTGLKNLSRMKNIGESAQDALQWLKSKQHKWLLLFDNADDPKINLNDYFPQCSHGNILITSRNPGLCVHAGAHCAVSDMEEQDAVDLLLRSAAQDTTDDTKASAAQIVKVLWYMPLAIIQAGAFISKSGNLGGYLELYAHNKARLLTERPGQLHDNYTWTVYTTWQISFEQLSQEAQTFLKLCSFLHYQGISQDIFKNATDYRFGPSSPSKEELEMALTVLSHYLGTSGVWDPFCFVDVINELRAYSLINFDSENNMLSIHPLVHEWTRSTQSDEIYHHCMAAIAGMSLAALSDQDLKVASQWMLPHIDFLMKSSLKNVLPDFTHQYAKVYLFAGKLEKAKELQTIVMEKRQNLLGKDHPDTLDAMYWLAWAYESLGLWKEAEEVLVVVLEKRRHILCDEHPDTLDAMMALATTYWNLGKFGEAEKFETALLKKRRSLLGENHPDTLSVMGNLACTYEGMGRFREAEELKVHVLMRQREILGDDHPETLMTQNNLANSYKLQGKLNKAEELEIMVFEKQRKILGDGHPDTLLSMANLSFTYYKLGKSTEAEVLALSVLEKRRNILGDSHPLTLLSMGNLGLLYSELGRLQEAEELEILILMKRRDFLGDSHPDTLRTMSNLGSTFNKLERWQEAEELLTTALRKQSDFLNDIHPHLVDTRQRLAVTYTKLGKLKQAEDLKMALTRTQS